MNRSTENVDTTSSDTDHWKIVVGQAQTVLATQAVKVSVSYVDDSGSTINQVYNLADMGVGESGEDGVITPSVYGFSPYNSDSLVTFADTWTIDGDETISSFGAGDEIYVKTHIGETPLSDVTITITYNPPGDGQAVVMKTYTGLSWNQPV